jgi:hypothetical protein
MLISDLIEELKEIKKAHGDLEVYVYADHGQDCTEAYAVGTQWVDEDGETYAEEDLHEFEDDELTLILEIAG